MEWIAYARAHGYSFADKMEAEHRAYLGIEMISKDTTLFSCLSNAMFWAFIWPKSQDGEEWWAREYSKVRQIEEAAQYNFEAELDAMAARNN